jgi:hypothetical protein
MPWAENRGFIHPIKPPTDVLGLPGGELSAQFTNDHSTFRISGGVGFYD